MGRAGEGLRKPALVAAANAGFIPPFGDFPFAAGRPNAVVAPSRAAL